MYVCALHFVRITSYECYPILVIGKHTTYLAVHTAVLTNTFCLISLKLSSVYNSVTSVIWPYFLLPQHCPVWPFSSSGNTATHRPDTQKMSGALQGTDQNHLWNVGVVFLSLTWCAVYPYNTAVSMYSVFDLNFIKHCICMSPGFAARIKS